MALGLGPGLGLGLGLGLGSATLTRTLRVGASYPDPSPDLVARSVEARADQRRPVAGRLRVGEGGGRRGEHVAREQAPADGAPGVRVRVRVRVR